MKAKIKWYREILELEPGSRVFFPLAKLLAQYGQHEDAAEVLRKGLLHHPDHLEAQMLLLEILHGLGRAEEVREMARCLADRFVSHPGFWRAWAEAMNTSDLPGAFPLSLHVLSALFGGRQISWDEVVEKGMSAVLSPGKDAAEQALAAEAAPLSAPSLPEAPLEDEPLDEDDYDEDEDETSAALASHEPETPPVLSADAEDDDEGGPLADEDDEDDSADLDDTTLESLDEGAEEAESEETFSLRTMTMAGLMADQGDYAGALDIYQELFDAAPNGLEKDKLGGLIEEMRRKLDEQAGGQPNAALDVKAPEQGQIGLNGKIKLKQTLEMLARRLEGRLYST